MISLIIKIHSWPIIFNDFGYHSIMLTDLRNLKELLNYAIAPKYRSNLT